MTRPASSTITFAQVILAEAAATLDTSAVELELEVVVAGMEWKNKQTIMYACYAVEVMHIPIVGQFVGDEVTVVVRGTSAGDVASAYNKKPKD